MQHDSISIHRIDPLRSNRWIYARLYGPRESVMISKYTQANSKLRSIVPGWDYVALDFYHDAAPVERIPLTGIERLAAAIEAQGTPPCGSLNGGTQCKWWAHCATQQMACKEYKDWQTEVGTGGDKVERARRANKVYAKRVPCRTIYNAIFTEAD